PRIDASGRARPDNGCHCEERSDEAISTGRSQAGTRLLRCARNDEEGTGGMMDGGPNGTGIGQPVRRREDLRLLTGNGRFSDDVSLPGQAYAVMVRSPHAHALIRGIDTAAARAA